MRSAATCALLAIALLRPGAAAEPAFVPAAGHDKAMLIEGFSAVEIRKIIDDFAALYRLRDFVYDLRPDGAAYRLTFPEGIAPALFPFLVNYLQYPKGFDVDKRPITVAGSATLTAGFNAPAPLLGQRALFYVPAGDQDFDLVYVKVGTQAYAHSFAASHWQPASDARMPPAIERLAARLAPVAPR